MSGILDMHIYVSRFLLANVKLSVYEQTANVDVSITSAELF